MLSIIVAFDQNMGIGINNKLPWHYAADLQYFKNTTLNHTVAMGRSTYTSIGKALPNRKNIVFSRDSKLELADAVVEINPINFFQVAQNIEEEIFVIGGHLIYELALPYAQKLYITKINSAFTVDTYFPSIDFSLYKIIATEEHGDLTFIVYERKE